MGFRDVLYFRDGYKPQRFNMKLPHPPALVDRWLRVGVQERFAPDGTEVAALDEQGVRDAAQQLPRGRRPGGRGRLPVVDAAYPEHERARPRSCAEELPGVDDRLLARRPAGDPRVGADLRDRDERLHRCRGSAST